jgi:adenylosuccinate lyase
MFALAEPLGKQTAHEAVYEASMRGLDEGITFEKALMESAQVQNAIGTQALKALLDPTTYVGFAPQIVDRVLADAHASVTEELGREH